MLNLFQFLTVRGVCFIHTNGQMVKSKEWGNCASRLME